MHTIGAVEYDYAVSQTLFILMLTHLPFLILANDQTHKVYSCDVNASLSYLTCFQNRSLLLLRNSL